MLGTVESPLIAPPLRAASRPDLPQLLRQIFDFANFASRNYSGKFWNQIRFRNYSGKLMIFHQIRNYLGTRDLHAFNHMIRL